MAFLNGYSREHKYIIAGDEFGPELKGKKLLIYKGLYGLTTSAARYHEVFSEQLRSMDFRPSRVDPDLWIRKLKDGTYDLMSTYVDDICVWSKAPMKVLDDLQKRFEMKGVGAPSFFLGADIIPTSNDWLRIHEGS